MNENNMKIIDNYFHLIEKNCLHLDNNEKEKFLDNINKYEFISDNKKAEYLIWNDLRKFVLDSIIFKQVEYTNIINHDLKGIYGKNSYIYSKEKLICVLSLLERNEFDYLINKYYFFKHTNYNSSYEKKIFSFLNGKNEAKGYFFSAKLDFNNVSENDIYECFSYLPEYFFKQINRRDQILPDPNISKNDFVAKRLNSYNFSIETVGILLFIFICFILYCLFF